MNVMVTGASGQLGSEVMKELAGRGYEATGMFFSAAGPPIYGADIIPHIHYEKTDITKRYEVMSLAERIKPYAIIHCAAWTDVDGAENPENIEKVNSINVEGTKNIAMAARNTGAKLLYISTDYVFGGDGDAPRKPDDEHFAPLNHYGRTKLEGEKAVSEYTDKYFIVRTSWVFGSGGKNFISTMIDLGYERDSVRVVNDQIGTPTYARDLAGLLVDMIGTDKYGYYHVTNSESEPGGYISWYDLTKEIYRQIGCDTEVIPVSTAEYGLRPAVRPYNSRLDKSKLIETGFGPLPDWKDAVRRYVREMEWQQ